MNGSQPPSVNGRATALVERLKHEAAALGITIARGDLGETLIDAGTVSPGSIEAGLRVAEICLGGLGTVDLVCDSAASRWPWTLRVHSSLPVIACLASQYAGWRLAHGDRDNAFFALGSGPARALARKEPLFDRLTYRDTATTATLVMESDRPPPAQIVAKIANDCGVEPGQLTIIYARTQSLTGAVQVVARVLEVALHKAHELGFPVERIVDGMGAAPLSPPHPELVAAMGRPNDSIIYAGRVHIFVTGPADEARALASDLPSATSRDYGRPFAEIFKSFNGDFYAIDPLLFSPAEVIVTALDTGQSFRSGRLDLSLLDASFA
jgi:methenyltetrahydromethanopterin cyclohydrolase